MTKPKAVPKPAPGIFTRLDRLERRVDALYFGAMRALNKLSDALEALSEDPEFRKRALSLVNALALEIKDADPAKER